MTTLKFLSKPPLGSEQEYVRCTFSHFDRRRIPVIKLRIAAFFLSLILVAIFAYLFQDTVAQHWLYTQDHTPRPTNELKDYAIPAIIFWALALALFAQAGQMGWNLATKTYVTRHFYVPRAAEALVLQALQKISKSR